MKRRYLLVLYPLAAALSVASVNATITYYKDEAVWFSRHGTLVATIESFVNQAPHGWFADELADALHAEVQDPLHDLVRGGRLRRTDVAGRFLYTAADSRQSRDQTNLKGGGVGPQRNSNRSLSGTFLLRNSRPPSCCFTVCWTSSNVVSSLAWNPSNWGTAATALWLRSSDWIRTPWPAGASNCSIKM